MPPASGRTAPGSRRGSGTEDEPDADGPLRLVELHHHGSPGIARGPGPYAGVLLRNRLPRGPYNGGEPSPGTAGDDNGRGVMNVLSEIADQARSLLDYRVRPLEPRTIVRRAVWAARWRSRGWGGTRRREVPNEYVVHVGTEDWLDYYQAMSKSAAEQLAGEIARRLLDGGYAVGGRVYVALCPDPSLGWGRSRIKASFRRTDDGGHDGPDPRGREGSEGGTPAHVPTGTADQPGTPACAWVEVPPCHTPVPCVTPAIGRVRTAVMRNDFAEAFLYGADSEYHVEPGTVVGVLRRPEDTGIPDVSLPADRYRYVSQDQGVFRYDGRAWHFRQDGGNETLVDNGGVRDLLKEGDECVVADGATMTFAGGASLTFRTTAA